jgi:hypothetical protein
MCVAEKEDGGRVIQRASVAHVDAKRLLLRR